MTSGIIIIIYLFRKSLCQIQGKDPLNEMFEEHEEEDSITILPEVCIENLSQIANEIKTDVLPTKSCRILDEICEDKVNIYDYL